jgi:hypothetical protein
LILEQLRAHDDDIGWRADAKFHSLALDGEHMDSDRAIEDYRLAGFPPQDKHVMFPPHRKWRLPLATSLRDTLP